MDVLDFLSLCGIPQADSEILHIELLTGCSLCGRRLLETRDESLVVMRGVCAMKVLDDETDVLVATIALCPHCRPKTKHVKRRED